MAVCFHHAIGQFAVRSLLCGPKSLKKGLNKVLRCLSTMRTWMLTSSFNILTWDISVKTVKKLNLIEEADSSLCLNISQYTVKKTEIDWKRFEIRENKWFLQQILANILAPDHVNKLLGHLQCFFQRPTEERWKRLRAKRNVQFLKDSSVALASEVTD